MRYLGVGFEADVPDSPRRSFRPQIVGERLSGHLS